MFDTLPPAVRAYIRHLEARLAGVEARLDQNASNSSPPPSPDGPHVKPAPPAPPSGKRRGGQPGHPRHDRVILPPDEVVASKPTHCRSRHAPVAGDDPRPISDQVIERPARLRHVTRHRRHTPACAGGAALTTAPAGPATGTGCGPRLAAATAYPSGVGRLGQRAIRTLFADLCAIPASLGAVRELEATARRALDPIHAEAHAHARGRDANVGATGWRQGKGTAWRWVAGTRRPSVFRIRPNRNRAAFDDRVGPTPGAPTTDRFPVYTHLAGDRRQVCRAHLRRDVQARIDRANRGSVIGGELLLHADLLCGHWQEVRGGTRTRRWFERTHAGWLRTEVRGVPERGTGCGCARTAGVCRDLLGVASRRWTSASRDGAEPTNNAAERAVRHAVCGRETSYGTDRERGRRFVERVLPVGATCRQQGRGILDCLVKAVAGAEPSLLPQGA